MVAPPLPPRRPPMATKSPPRPTSRTEVFRVFLSIDPSWRPGGRDYQINVLAGVAGSARAPGSAPAEAGVPEDLGASRAGRAPGGPSFGELVVSEGLSHPAGPSRRVTMRWPC